MNRASATAPALTADDLHIGEQAEHIRVAWNASTDGSSSFRRFVHLLRPAGGRTPVVGVNDRFNMNCGQETRGNDHTGP